MPPGLSKLNAVFADAVSFSMCSNTSVRSTTSKLSCGHYVVRQAAVSHACAERRLCVARPGAVNIDADYVVLFRPLDDVAARTATQFADL